MPLYTYKCKNDDCDHSEDKIVKIAEREQEFPCSKCTGGKLVREAFTAGDKGSSFRYKGNWFSTTGRY